MHLSPQWLWLLFILRRWFCCWLLLPLWDSVVVLCFIMRYFVSILALQSSRWGRESWLLCFVCLPGVSWLLCGSSSRHHGFVCSLWLWYSWSYSFTIFEMISEACIGVLGIQDICHFTSKDIGYYPFYFQWYGILGSIFLLLPGILKI